MSAFEIKTTCKILSSLQKLFKEKSFTGERMKRYILLLLIIITYTLSAYEIENFTTTFVDENRDNREIETLIYYPSIDSSQTFPVIVFGHGWLMSYSNYDYLINELVATGSIMAFPRTEEGFFPDHEDFGLDLAFIVDRISEENHNNESNLFGLINEKKIVMGHSMGGACTILAAKENQTIDAVINFAAAETDPSAIDAAENVLCPTLIFSGEDDNIASPESNQLPMYENIASETKYFLNILDEGHMGITSNSSIPVILNSFINYIESESYLDFNIFHQNVDSLDANGILEYQCEIEVSNDEEITISENKISCYPNPFNVLDDVRNTGSTICFELDKKAFVNLEVYNAKGQLIKIIENSMNEIGMHNWTWNGCDTAGKVVSSGIYLYRLRLNGKNEKFIKTVVIK
jgi:dienelactone hydrolase